MKKQAVVGFLMLSMAAANAAETGQVATVSCAFTQMTGMNGKSYPMSGLKMKINLKTKKVIATCMGGDEETCVLDGNTRPLAVTEIQGDQPSFVPISEPLGNGRGSAVHSGLDTLNIEGSNGDDTDLFIRIGFDVARMPADGFGMTARAIMTTACDESMSSVSDFVACRVKLEE